MSSWFSWGSSGGGGSGGQGGSGDGDGGQPPVKTSRDGQGSQVVTQTAAAAEGDADNRRAVVRAPSEQGNERTGQQNGRLIQRHTVLTTNELRADNEGQFIQIEDVRTRTVTYRSEDPQARQPRQ